MKSAYKSFMAMVALSLVAGGCADLADHDYRVRYPIGVWEASDDG